MKATDHKTLREAAEAALLTTSWWLNRYKRKHEFDNVYFESARGYVLYFYYRPDCKSLGIQFGWQLRTETHLLYSQYVSCDRGKAVLTIKLLDPAQFNTFGKYFTAVRKTVNAQVNIAYKGVPELKAHDDYWKERTQ